MLNRAHLRGMTIVEVLVASAILAITVAAFSSFLSFSNKEQKSVQNSVDFDIIRSNIQRVLMKDSLCNTAWKAADGVSAAKFNPTATIPAAQQFRSIKAGSSTLISLGQNLPGGLKVSKLELTSVSTTGPNVYDVTLVIEIQKATGSTGGSLLSNKDNPFLFSVATNSTDNIVSCGAAASSPTVKGSVCGGFTTKFGSGWCAGCTYATFGCGVTGGSCPAGYSTWPSGFISSANAENTWICVKN